MAIHTWLSRSYWSFDVPLEVLDRAIDGDAALLRHPRSGWPPGRLS